MHTPSESKTSPDFAPAGMSLFRFLNCETSYFSTAVERLVRDNQIYLSSRRGFNDPFDMNPILKADWTTSAIREHMKNLAANPWQSAADPAVISRFLQSGARPSKEVFSTKSIRVMKQKFPTYMAGLLDAMGVCCFTEEMQNPLFWAHYATAYSGLCIELKATGDTSHPFCNLMKVHYSSQRPIVYASQTGAFSTAYREHNWDYIAQYGICTKSNDWAVEKEWRLWIVEAAGSYQTLPPQTLNSIFLGPLIKESIAASIVDLVRSCNSSARVFRTTLSETDFRVEIGKRAYLLA